MTFWCVHFHGRCYSGTEPLVSLNLTAWPVGLSRRLFDPSGIAEVSLLLILGLPHNSGNRALGLEGWGGSHLVALGLAGHAF